MDAEAKEKEIIDTKIAVEGTPLSEKEEFAILEGKGIEYKTGNITFIIPNIKVREYLRMIEFEEKQKQAKGGAEILALQMEYISKYTNASKDELIDNMDKQDCDRVISLLFYSWLEGKAIFKKKMLAYSEVWERILLMRRVAKEMSLVG